MEKYKKYLFITLGVFLSIILGTSIYVNVASSASGFTYILIAQIFVGILSVLATLFLGLYAFPKKKNYELMLFSFLESLFVLGILIFNYVYGYGGAVNSNNYIEHMEYISMEFTIYLYVIFVIIIGLLTLDLFVKERISLLSTSKKSKCEEEKA